MASHKELIVWQKSMNLTQKVYEVTAFFPYDEKYGLVSQMRRCAISITSNIAEGYGRDSDKELVNFLYISVGSCNELDTQLELSKRFGFVEEQLFRETDSLNQEVLKMLKSLIYRRKNHLDSFHRTVIDEN